MFEIGIGTALSIDNGYLRVRLDAPGCANCSLSCRMDGLIIALNRCEASVGDRVRIMENESFIIRLRLIQFGIPLIFFVAGLVSPYRIHGSEWLSLASGFASLFMGGAIARFVLRRLTKAGRPVFIAGRVVVRNATVKKELSCHAV